MADITAFLFLTSFTLLLGLGLLVLLDLAVNWSIKKMNRPKQTLPRRERDLLGDDYRECVADYFDRKRTRRQIVREVAGVRPK